MGPRAPATLTVAGVRSAGRGWRRRATRPPRPRRRPGERADDELRQAGVDVAVDEVAQADSAHRDEGQRVDVWTAAGEWGQEVVLGGDAGVGDAHAKVLGIDLAPCAARRLLDVATGDTRLGRGQLSAQPAISDPPDAVQRLGSASAQPHLQRILDRARGRCQVVECPAVGPMLHGLARPPAPHQAEYLLQHVAPPRTVEPERLALPRLADAGDEAEQQPAAGHLIELSQLLGQQERVAAEGDEVGAQVKPAGAAGGQRQPEQRVKHRGDGKVREPHPVEPGHFERLGERRHLRSGEGSGVRADGEADLHVLTA